MGLADSIRERGVLQPIIVQPGTGRGYQLIAGERRWRASRIAGLSTIPVLVYEKPKGVGSIELAPENMAREDLSVIEEARTIALLLDDLQVTAGTQARRLGRSRSGLAHTVRLLDLPDEAIELIDAGALTKGHGKPFLPSPTITAVARWPAGRPTPAGLSARSKLRSPATRTAVGNPPSRVPISRPPRPGSKS